MSLSTVMEEIKKVGPAAKENIEEGPMSTLNARRGRKNQAIERLKALKDEYIRELMKGSTFIVVTGGSRNEFTAMATEQFHCFANDPESFYRDLANRIPESTYLGRESMPNIFDIVSRHLEDKALEMNIIGYPQLIFKSKYNKSIKSKEEFVGVIKEALVEQLGGEMTGIQAVRAIAVDAIAREHSAKITPIILSTSDDAFALKIAEDLERLTSKVFVVVVGKASKALKATEGALLVKEVTPEAVEQTLTTIKQSLRR